MDRTVKPAIEKVARISAIPGKAAQLRVALKTLEAATRKEPGCVEFVFFQALSDEDSFVLLERFADEEALQVHMRLPHTQTFFKAGLVASVRAIDVPVSGGKQLF